MAAAPRWADLVDSEEDEGPAPVQPQARRAPFDLMLHSYMHGLFQPDISRGSLARLQRVLRAHPRTATLRPGLHDLVVHLRVRRREIRRQVRAFVLAVLRMECSPAAARVSQIWLRLQTYYEPPTWNRLAYYLVVMHTF